MNFSKTIKERFCKDCNLAIKLFNEPYFMDRILLYDNMFHSLNKWNLFCTEYERLGYKNEQDYLQEYGRIKDAAINAIKESNGFKNFEKTDYSLPLTRIDSSISNKSIYHKDNDGKLFLSIDMCTANFSSLACYDNSIFDGCDSWKTWLNKFTDNQHILNSKYIRQVILGNCNPKRQVSFEKRLMKDVLEELIVKFKNNLGNDIAQAVMFSNDEIIFKIDNSWSERLAEIKSVLYDIIKRYSFPLNVEFFMLAKDYYNDVYYKFIIDPTPNDFQISFVSMKIKCADSELLPFILRGLEGESIQKNDLVFSHNGNLAKFLYSPEVDKDICEIYRKFVWKI